MGHLLGVLTFLIFCIFSIIGLTNHFKFNQKYVCKNCSQKINASQIVCQHCGTFLEKNSFEKKAVKYMGRHFDGRYQEGIKKLDRRNK